MGRTFVLVNGVRLGIEQRGETRNCDQTLVLLHGFTGSAAGWGHQMDTLADYGLRIIALDLLGHGQSDAPDDAERYSIENCQKDILAALQELGVKKGHAIILGYSMGGRIALYTAFSGFFRAVVLESASPGLEDPAEREERRASDEALAASIEREGVPAFIERWERLPLFASQRTLPIECREALHRQRLQNNATGLAQSLRGVGTGVQPSLYAQLPTLLHTCPADRWRTRYKIYNDCKTHGAGATAITIAYLTCCWSHSSPGTATAIHFPGRRFLSITGTFLIKRKGAIHASRMGKCP